MAWGLLWCGDEIKRVFAGQAIFRIFFKIFCAVKKRTENKRCACRGSDRAGQGAPALYSFAWSASYPWPGSTGSRPANFLVLSEGQSAFTGVSIAQKAVIANATVSGASHVRSPFFQVASRAEVSALFVRRQFGSLRLLRRNAWAVDRWRHQQTVSQCNNRASRISPGSPLSVWVEGLGGVMGRGSPELGMCTDRVRLVQRFRCY